MCCCCVMVKHAPQTCPLVILPAGPPGPTPFNALFLGLHQCVWGGVGWACINALSGVNHHHHHDHSPSAVPLNGGFNRCLQIAGCPPPQAPHPNHLHKPACLAPRPAHQAHLLLECPWPQCCCCCCACPSCCESLLNPRALGSRRSSAAPWWELRPVVAAAALSPSATPLSDNVWPCSST
jgi:hypothetical protein